MLIHKKDTAVEDLIGLLRGRRTLVLTGAGCSTESGIPDYRGPQTRLKARNPIQYRAFLSDPLARARYWARSMAGWPHIASARPHSGHHALARLEEHGRITGVITQNVDRLHQAGGTREVVELHGALEEVICLECGDVTRRETMQQRLLALNPEWDVTATEIAPDGDAEIDYSRYIHFHVPACTCCGGPLKPNVIFFGENVPGDRVERAWRMYDQSDALLVVGSSLAVYSGYRFVLRASKDTLPIGILNLGDSRGDALAHCLVRESFGASMPRIAEGLLAF
ncbi:MAG: NAD-dependent protein deacetylase [Rhodothermales bacterium]